MQEHLLRDNNIHRVDSGGDEIALDDYELGRAPQQRVVQQQEDVSVDPNAKKLTCGAKIFRIIFSILSVCIIISCIFIG